MLEKDKMIDLGLSYLDAAHGMQTGVAYEMEQSGRSSATDPKHLRTGLNAAMTEHMGLACLLMDKGVFTEDEYREYMRLAMNNELARYESLHPGLTFR